MFSKIVLLCFVAIAGIVLPVLAATKCYQCEYFNYYGSNSTNDEKCKDSSLPETFLKTCNSTIDGTQPSDWQCTLVRGRIEVDEENYEIVQRGCSPGKQKKAECKNTKSFETRHGFIKRGSECICNEDKCNTGNDLKLGLITLGLALIFSQI